MSADCDQESTEVSATDQEKQGQSSNQPSEICDIPAKDFLSKTNSARLKLRVCFSFYFLGRHICNYYHVHV